MKKYLLALVVVVALTLGSVAYAATTYRLYTLNGFVEMLIGRGIVPAQLAPKARELAGFITGAEDVIEEKKEEPLNKAYAEVGVSQLIEYGTLRYKEGSDVKGLLLTLKNASSSMLMFEAKRGCQVVYRIFKGDELLFDSAKTDRCTTDDYVVYELAGNGVRMFPVTHKQTDLPLAKGEYRFELEYPEYGKGERLVTIE